MSLILSEKTATMASVDLKDAFFSIPVQEEDQKYLKFLIRKVFYNFTCMPNGYGPAMRTFTKLLKSPFAHLRQMGHTSVIYVDDSYLQGNTKTECMDNIKDTIFLLRNLGFTIHYKKSILEPSQSITFLGFIFDSCLMTIELTLEKKDKIYLLCSKLINDRSPSIRHVAKVIGNMVASFPAVPYGKLFYRQLELDKIQALRKNKGNFDKTCHLSENSLNELHWWVNNIQHSKDDIHKPPVDITVYTDASLTGWGIDDGKNPSGGLWSAKDAQKHINVLELKANYIGIVTYCKDKNYKHVRIMTDNTTAISYINNMGGIKSAQCNKQALKIWSWCINASLWLSAAFIAGKDNKTADEKSRHFNEAIEWMLIKLNLMKLSINMVNPI